MTKDNKTLHLVQKRKWWDMIASGEKKEEYREICGYWIKRLIEGEYQGSDKLNRYKPFKNVCFHLGYTNTTMTFRIVRIRMGYGLPQWGGIDERGINERVFIIILGERIE